MENAWSYIMYEKWHPCSQNHIVANNLSSDSYSGSNCTIVTSICKKCQNDVKCVLSDNKDIWNCTG